GVAPRAGARRGVPPPVVRGLVRAAPRVRGGRRDPVGGPRRRRPARADRCSRGARRRPGPVARHGAGRPLRGGAADARALRRGRAEVGTNRSAPSGYARTRVRSSDDAVASTAAAMRIVAAEAAPLTLVTMARAAPTRSAVSAPLAEGSGG